MSNYSDLIIYQYHQKPKAKATIDLLCGESDKVIENLTDLMNQWDIDQARGYSLDIIGRRIGVSRELPSFISKGYLGYLNSKGGKPWGKGAWYRSFDPIGSSLVLEDDDYQFLIKAKIKKNFQDGTLAYVLKSIKEILSDKAKVTDNLNMSATITLPLSNLNSLQTYMIQSMDILPRPIGVMYKYVDG